MRKSLMVLSMLLVASMLLIACGAEETQTVVPEIEETEVFATEEPLTEEPIETEEPTTTETVEPATEQPTEEGIPVTGAENPFLLQNQLDYDVWNAENEQIGEVENMVIDLANSRVSYVLIETGGFLDIGDTESLVPWNALRLALNEDPDVLSSDDNVFLLEVDQNLLADAPAFDPADLPALGEPAEDWDAGFAEFWETAGVEGVEPAEGAARNEAQGVIMATDLLFARVVFDPDVDLTGVDFGGQMTVDNVIVDPDTGQVEFVVLNTFFANEPRLIPVPLSHFRWDESLQLFILDAEPGMLQDAPFFSGELPNAFEEGMRNEYFDYWQ